MTPSKVRPELVSNVTAEPVKRPHLCDVPQFPGLIGTFMGRDALTLALSCLNLTESDTVLLPLYTCQDVLQSFVRKCRVVFYDVEPDLTITPDELRARLAGQNRVKLVLITNYFGFLQPHRKEIKKLCGERGICLIEDCAHSLLTQGSGETGDFAVYSLRKILPLRDGGGLAITEQTGTRAVHYHSRIYSDTLSFLALGKSLLNLRTEKLSRARVSSGAEKVLPLPNELSHVLPLSDFARRKIKTIPLHGVSQKRRDDFQMWEKQLCGNRSITPVFQGLPEGVCPFGFPIRLSNRESLESRAKQKGIHLRVHWRLSNTLGTDCNTSHDLSKQMLTLPLYPELSPRERDTLIELMARG
jgi:perosamine synthetase